MPASFPEFGVIGWLLGLLVLPLWIYVGKEGLRLWDRNELAGCAFLGIALPGATWLLVQGIAWAVVR